MRDNHEGMPEIVRAEKQKDNFFCVVGLERRNKRSQFQFGISYDGYLTLCRLFETRPFDLLPGIKYRYFFSPGVRRLNANRAMMTVRIEQDKNCKEIEIEAPTDLVANFMWFYELDDLGKAEHLRINHE